MSSRIKYDRGEAVLPPMLIGENGIFYAEIMAWTGAAIILVISYFAVIRKMERTLAVSIQFLTIDTKNKGVYPVDTDCNL